MAPAEDAVMDDEEQPKIPVTVLTGALGAGKTTLLKYVLEKPHGYKVAVIQNEFSDIMGMEAPLFTDDNGETIKDVYELPNGCLCCSAKDGLIGMLDVLIDQRKKFDYVLVEATGVADPEALCDIFWVDDGLGSAVYLDGVVTLVDGRNCLSALDGTKGDAADLGLEHETAKQVASADVLILNKTDLTTTQQRELISARLSAINPMATLLESSYSQVPLGEILGIRAFDHVRLVNTLAALAEQSRGHGRRGIKSKFCAPYAPNVGHGIESCMVCGLDEQKIVYDPEKVRAWMADVLWEGVAGGVYRCKGLFLGLKEPESDDELLAASDESEVAYTLQGVGKLFEIDPAPRVEVPQSRFLFIGRGLKQDVLQSGLQRCQAS